MGIYDELDKEVLTTKPQSTSIKNNNNSGGLFDELDNEVLSQQQTQPTFAENHPFLASTPEALKPLGQGAIHSFPEFGKGLNDLVALV